MRVLLDTHTFLWFIEGNSNIGQKALKEILEPSNERFLSIACLWEIAIKVKMGKLKSQGSFHDLIQSQIVNNDIQLLAISANHLNGVQTLTLHHRDPFDRLIIAQAISENLTILTKDSSFSSYSVKTLW